MRHVETERAGLDKHVRFGKVERVASQRVGRETVTYVRKMQTAARKN